ncbi:hypothetical protein R3X27_05240 [Tropicimonas sp. TH_r6]|uniref:hypothetical protein n=1 Tax=Tropicimonas sp. TH_r6 TaxID=3082085 RepID=UPI002955BA4C|nr:hypothetical protein [Tropicimonas sp. TH_r6]MDV7142081.1 hypothetical protein [Tropicimonas sp. TH_r6]
MRNEPEIVLILGSGPGAVAARDWETHPFDAIVAINNAWAVRPDWTHHIHPKDFPAERGPADYSETQAEVTFRDYVPTMNAHGGVVHIGGTMAFTAGCWAVEALRPRVLAFLGCDMVYPATGPTHFYGTGTADPLRPDPTLRSLEAKAARLALGAARRGVACVNLSGGESRLVYPRAGLTELAGHAPARDLPVQAIARAEQMERDAGYFVEDGRYWKQQDGFDLEVIDAIDAAWLTAWEAFRG